jgi:hypothetical protein
MTVSLHVLVLAIDRLSTKCARDRMRRVACHDSAGVCGLVWAGSQETVRIADKLVPNRCYVMRLVNTETIKSECNDRNRATLSLLTHTRIFAQEPTRSSSGHAPTPMGDRVSMLALLDYMATSTCALVVAVEDPIITHKRRVEHKTRKVQLSDGAGLGMDLTSFGEMTVHAAALHVGRAYSFSRLLVNKWQGVVGLIADSLSTATELAVGSPDAAELVRAYDDACRLDTFHFREIWPEHSPGHMLCALAKLYEQRGNSGPTRRCEATLVGFKLAPGAELVHFGRMTSVHLPSSVSVIGGSCFSGCRSLASITLESGSQLSQLEADAFDERGLTSIHLPASVTVIGESCFSCCC